VTLKRWNKGNETRMKGEGEKRERNKKKREGKRGVYNKEE
jgi:hypothetical protein